MSTDLIKHIVDDLVATRIKLEKAERKLNDLESSMKSMITNDRVVAFFIKVLSSGVYDRRTATWNFEVAASDLEMCHDFEALETISRILKNKVKK